MQTYIAILRGINVGGKHKLPMADLREVLSSEGLDNVQTYIQSGNVVFRAEEENTKVMAKHITRLIKNRWGYNVPVIVMNADDFSEILSVNPFSTFRDISVLHITYLDENSDPEQINSLSGIQDPPNDFAIGKRAVYMYCPDGYSKTRLTNTFIENKLKVTATTRNMKTSLVLQKMTQ
jgi:uncharacterized protein (DUF1697 family)